MNVDPQVLAASLRRLVERASTPATVVAALDEVTEACVGMFGVSGAGVMIADQQNVTRYVAASDGPGRLLETLESQYGQGPCTEAFLNRTVCDSSDLVTDPRWPQLGAAIAGHGVHAALGVPVTLGGVPVGTLDVYRDHPHQWDDSECAALVRYSEVVQTTLEAALRAHTAGEIADQLQYALDHRVVVERAIGYLMARERLDSVAAFHLLRQAARSSRTKIGAAAEQLLDTGDLPR